MYYGSRSVKIRVRVADAIDGHWMTFIGDAPDGSDKECYALPGNASRAEFWSARLGQDIPDGRGLIWTIDD